MINRNELRIGSLVQYLNGYAEVLDGDDLEILATSGDEICITVKILEQLGFVENEDCMWYHPDHSPVNVISGSTPYSVLLVDNQMRQVSCEFRSLHNLQNAVFAISGRELDITPLENAKKNEG